MAHQQQLQEVGPGSGYDLYPTPVVNARSRFVELLNKYNLPINKFLNEEIEIGVNDLTNLDHSKFVELCQFFKLNAIEKIRFEKLANELSDGEEHFNSLKAKSIDTYNHNKTIATSMNEQYIIQKLDNEHEKMQQVSQLTELMISRTNDKCSASHEHIDKIFDAQKESILKMLENKKQELHRNINKFQEQQLKYIQSQFKDIDEYQAEIRQVCIAQKIDDIISMYKYIQKM